MAALSQGTPLAAPSAPSGTYAPILSRVTGAVVNIQSVLKRTGPTSPLERDSMFGEFFQERTRERRPIAVGSGVIVDAQRGLVVTNHHVIANAESVTVTLRDRREFAAQYVGSDAATDIALLRIEADHLTAITIGDSDRLSVGDVVLAIGNPFGIGQSVTAGIVSALKRASNPFEFQDFVQTDALINPGNSGGALVDVRGELIGINTERLISQSGEKSGLGYAVPSNMLTAVVAQLQRYGEVRRGRIGVSGEDVTPGLAKARGLAVSEGAYVVRVDRGSVGEAAGVRVGDVVTAINGHSITTQSDLRNRVGLIAVGDRVNMELLRNGQPVRVSMNVAPIGEIRITGGSATVPQLAGARFSDTEVGVAVTGTESGSVAYIFGLRAGDVIDAINGQPVRRVQDLAALIKTSDRFLVTVLRGDSKLSLFVR
jgi:serine protease Do/serine protease DegQ